jgi:hypothetical protein
MSFNPPFGNTPPAYGPQGYIGMVEQVLMGLGVDPNQSRLQTDEGYGWTFRRGSAVIEVYITQQGNDGYFQVLSPIIHLPQAGLLPLYRRMLEMNLKLTNASLGLFQDVVYLFSERALVGLDPQEAQHIITLVAGYADEYDDALISEFGGRLYSRA